VALLLCHWLNTLLLRVAAVGVFRMVAVAVQVDLELLLALQ
jgi:hypothetical protein